MSRKMMSTGKIKGSLARKLVITIVILLIVGGSISWYILIDEGKKNLTDKAIRYVASYSDLIKKSTRFSMLTFHREAIQQTIEDIAYSEDIKKIRLFDSKGKIFYSSAKEEIGQMVNSDTFACRGCHLDPKRPLETLTDKRRWVIYNNEENDKILTFIEPVYNEPSCYTAACHIHSGKQKVLGIIETDFSLASLDKIIRQQTINITIYAFLFLAAGSFFLYFILRRFVLKPVSVLSSAMDKVKGGDLKYKVHIRSKDEMGYLAGAFNEMTEELEYSRERLQNWAQTLEEEVTKKTEELKRSQDKLIQAEKLASLGRLTSDVAHEIRNPLTAIGGFARRLNKIATGAKEKEYAEIVVAEVSRLEKILRDILTFSRDARCHLQRHKIEKIVSDTVKMYEELCREQSVNIEITIEENLPPVLIDKEQAIQSLGNLITNAIDAMSGGGTLRITEGKEVLHDVEYVFIKVSDTGKGISKDKLPLIFEPFFSTKETGHGTGLGLSITRKIIEEHGGFIKAESAAGKGSAFSLYFPYQSEEESLKINCWDYMKCNRDKDATIKCPAYPDFGRICWAVAGTFCEGKAQGTFAQKYEDCRKCPFYQKRVKKEV
jgi:two-component system NtrC family sensor kinase